MNVTFRFFARMAATDLLLALMVSLVSMGQTLRKANTTATGVFADGTVTGLPGTPFGDHPAFTIYAIRGTDTIDVAHTDATGYYAFQHIPVGTPEHGLPLAEPKLFPNPYQHSTSLVMFAPKKESYTFIMFDAATGKLAFTKQLMLEGNNTINVTGGSAGAYTMLLQNKDTTYTFKAIQRDGNGNAIDANITPTPSKLKETMFDQVKFVYSNPKYEKPDTTLELSSPMIHLGNRNIWKLKDIYNFQAIALNHKDTVRSHGAIKIDWNNGSGDKFTYPADASGKINVDYESYFDRPDTIFISNADTTLTTQMMWARHPQTITNYPALLSWANMFQSHKEQLQPVTAARVNPDTLTGTFNLFFQVKEVPHPFIPGQTLRIEGPEFQSYTHSSSPGSSIRYTYAPQVIDSIDNFRMLRDETTNAVVSTTLQNLMAQEQDSAFKTLTLPYGINLAPPIRTENVLDAATNARYQASLARGSDQMMKTQFRSNNTSGFATSTTTLYSIIVNGQSTGRIKGSYSKYAQDVSYQEMRDEMNSQINNCDDVMGGNATPYVVSSTGANTEFIYVATYTVYMNNPLTPWKNPHF